jgi:membrane-associated phospholipid phosphatase
MCSYGSILFFFFLKGSIYDFMTPLKLKWVISAMIFSFSFVLPVINIYILYKLNRISSLTLENQNERTFPYIITSCFYFGLFYLFLDLNIWPSIKVLIFGGGLSVLLTAIINLKYRISAHAVGIGGLIASLMMVSFVLKYNAVPEIAFLFLLAGLIAAARLYLDAHKPLQVYSGFLLGFATQLIVFVFFLNFKL